VYFSLSDGNSNAYDLTVGADGKERSRARFEHATGQFTRIAAGPWSNGTAHVPGFAERALTLAKQKEESAKGAPDRPTGGCSGPPLPEACANDWHTFDAIVDMDLVWPVVNGRRGSNAATNDRMMDYRPIVLHVGGAGEVRFKSISYFLGPDYTERHEFTGARSYGPATFPEGLTYFTYDFTSDGRADIIGVYSRPICLYVNPKGQSHRWDRYNMVPEATAEIELFRDIDGDGRTDVVNGRGRWEQPLKAVSEGLWEFHSKDVTALVAHGLGLAWFEQKRYAAGEIRFVRHDILGNFGAKNAGGVTFSELHTAAFADLDGEGIPDMLVGKRLFSHSESHLDPDPCGLAVLYWYRTVRNPKAEGGAEFVPELSNNCSGVGSQFEIKDLNGDGAPDVVHFPRKRDF
jgi:hypothetical protein